MSSRVDLFISVYCGLCTSATLLIDHPDDEIKNQTNLRPDSYHARFIIGPTATQPFNSLSMVNRLLENHHIPLDTIVNEINNTPNLSWSAFLHRAFQMKGKKHDIINRTKHLCHGGFEFSQKIKDSTRISVKNIFNSRIYHTKTYVCLGERVKIIFVWKCVTNNSWFTITQYIAECHCIVFHC